MVGMVLHLGGDVTVPLNDIIAIIDKESADQSAANREFINIAREEGFVRRISHDPPKSIVLAEVDKKTVLFLSPISSVTLMKRSRKDTDHLYKRLNNKGESK
jgi:hypothetical protein